MHCIFLHSSVEGHLVCSHDLAIVNGAAGSTGVHVAFKIRVLSEYMPRSEIAGPCGNIIFSFLGNLRTGFHHGYSNLSSYRQCEKDSFAPHPLFLLPVLISFLQHHFYLSQKLTVLPKCRNLCSSARF